MIKLNMIYAHATKIIKLKKIPKGFSNEGFILNKLEQAEIHPDIFIHGSKIDIMLRKNGIAILYNKIDCIKEYVYILINDYILCYNNYENKYYDTSNYTKIGLAKYKLIKLYQIINKNTLMLIRTMLDEDGLDDETIQQILEESTEVV